MVAATPYANHPELLILRVVVSLHHADLQLCVAPSSTPTRLDLRLYYLFVLKIQGLKYSKNQSSIQTISKVIVTPEKDRKVNLQKIQWGFSMFFCSIFFGMTIDKFPICIHMYIYISLTRSFPSNDMYLYMYIM